MILLALSFASWMTCALTGFLSFAALITMGSHSRQFNRATYLIAAGVTGAVSFYIFHQLGGPRQW